MLHFLGIGAQKSGTTWLYRCLAKHPDLGFPSGKEVHFWDRWQPGQPTVPYFERFKDDRLFEGEITPAYAILPVEVIAEIERVAPNLRMIFLMRNPIDRAWSSALMALGRAEMAYGEASAQWFLDHFLSNGSLSRGDYARCLERWWSVFPREAILVRNYEEITDAPSSLLKAVCAHLQVSAPTPGMIEACRDRVFAGAGHEIPKELRRFLLDLYTPRIRRLEALLDRSFQQWLDGS
ncbi:sulfotransferase [Algiphilus sp.]|uniref:sulfotransferase family protein n=1 Tax=Algiphilus sp. TaxID=1872431 RepID=UPI0032EC3BF0